MRPARPLASRRARGRCAFSAEKVGIGWLTSWLTCANLSNMSQSDHLGTAQAAALLGKSPATVKRMAKSGELPYLFKMDGETGAYVFSRAVLAAYLKAQVAA